MIITGLITEYNPFHNGHQYHLEKAKQLTGADYLVVIMSGDFVQRGAPAITDKYTRTKMALEGGADLVIELPVCYATASAEFFAYGAVSAFHAFKIIDAICFGSECANIEELWSAAYLLSKESNIYSDNLKALLRQGISFPAARQQAILAKNGSSFAADILSSPNNILGIEYLKALIRLKSPIKAYTIKRKQNDYHSTDFSFDSSFASASAIRSFYQKEQKIDLLKEKMPPAAFYCLKTAKNHTFPILENDFSLLFYYKLLSETAASLTKYWDVPNDLAIRIYNHILKFTTYEEFASLLKTKQYTMSRIHRSLLHILLDIKAKEMALFLQEGGTLYARILGFQKKSSSFIRTLEKYSSIPILTKPAHAKKKLSSVAYSMFEKDLFASHLYQKTASDKFQTDFQSEYQRGPIMI